MNQQEAIDAFFDAIKPFEPAYRDPVVQYVAVRHRDQFVLIQGRLIFLYSMQQFSPWLFQTANVLAEQYALSQIDEKPREIISQLLRGTLPTPTGPVHFPTNRQGENEVSYIPFHPEGLRNQSRLSVLDITGAERSSFLRLPDLDWELRSAPTPYESLQELMLDFQLGPLHGDVARFETVATQLVMIDYNSPVSGTKAEIRVQLARGISAELFTLGYRIVSKGEVVTRDTIIGKDFAWTTDDVLQHGVVKIDIPEAAVIHCFARCAEIAQHYAWLADLTTFQNPRRAVFEVVDGGLETLQDFIERQPGKGNSHDLDHGVAWLLWMLGFSVLDVGSSPKTRDFADIIAVTPGGHYAVIECTTGLLRSDKKLPKLIERTNELRRQLTRSNHRSVRVLPVIVTSKMRADVLADLEQTEKLGIAVVTLEALKEGVTRTLTQTNADQIYEDAEEAVRSAQGKHSASETWADTDTD